MSRARRSLAAVLAVVVTIGLAPGPAFGEDDGSGGGNNVALVENYHDGATRTRARTALEHESGPTVDNENVAIAYSECTDCRTVAVAVQAVIVEGDVTDFRPANAAAAANVNCLRCQTFAYARQEILLADAHVHLSDEAQAQYDGIREAIREVSRSDMTFDDMIAQLDGLVDELVALLQSQVDQSGAHADEHAQRDVKRDEHDDQG